MSCFLLISPHLDDAVLSCGAAIAQQVSNGHTVVTATVFTTPGNNATPGQQAFYAARRNHDIKATQLLGSAYKHLGFTDAPFRNKAWHNFSTLLFHHQVPETEQSLVQEITISLQQLIADLQPSHLLFPLGVGGHIDHHLVFESSRRLVRRPARTGYYEELPYALVAHWPTVRWWQLGAQPVHMSENGPVVKTDLGAVPLAFLDHYITDAADRRDSLAAWHKEWEMIPAFTGVPDAWLLHHERMTYEPCYTTGHYFRDKCSAIAAYTTEWPALFGDHTDSITHTLATQSDHNRYRESCWYINNSL